MRKSRAQQAAPLLPSLFLPWQLRPLTSPPRFGYTDCQHRTVRTNFNTAGGAALFSHTRLRGTANPKNLIRLIPA